MTSNAFLTQYGLSTSTILGVFVTVAVFATILSIVLPFFANNDMKYRMKAVALERDAMRSRERARLSAEKESGRKGDKRRNEKGLAETVVESLDLQKLLADDKTIAMLRTAGFRGQRPLTLFVFTRTVMPFGLLAFALIYIFSLGLLSTQPLFLRLGACLGAAALGFYLPNIYISNIATKRKKSIQRAWPDALDLLLICVEAGNSIEAALRRVSDEIGIQSVPLAEELVLVCAELAYLTDRKAAYDNLAARVDLDAVRAACTTLVQAEKYGTSVGQALRTLSQESRDYRMNLAEKTAAALPPKLTVPMIVFFLPVLFAIIMTPAAIQAMKTM